MEEGDSVTGVSCSYDGYIGSAGLTLYTAFSDRDLLRKLIGKGDISSLGTGLGNTSFCRGESRCRTYPAGEDLCSRESAEYAYILGKDGRWRYFRSGDPGERDLESDLKTLAE